MAEVNPQMPPPTKTPCWEEGTIKLIESLPFVTLTSKSHLLRLIYINCSQTGQQWNILLLPNPIRGPLSSVVVSIRSKVVSRHQTKELEHFQKKILKVIHHLLGFQLTHLAGHTYSRLTKRADMASDLFSQICSAKTRLMGPFLLLTRWNRSKTVNVFTRWIWYTTRLRSLCWSLMH